MNTNRPVMSNLLICVGVSVGQNQKLLVLETVLPPRRNPLPVIVKDLAVRYISEQRERRQLTRKFGRGSSCYGNHRRLGPNFLGAGGLFEKFDFILEPIYLFTLRARLSPPDKVKPPFRDQCCDGHTALLFTIWSQSWHRRSIALH